ncbi:MAG: chemotaxis response regulator protein-glutamate methylesterase [Euryarchaeota archaeon]|nr:chemotaxis response regulator protein-glutamate methylesterase [Euryarchaeota archaeon]
MKKPIRVLVVDDSALMRRMISDMINSSPDCVVVDTARDGGEAIEKVNRLKPDVVTLDVEMPRIDGIEALAHIMMHMPTPVVMLSALTREGAETTMKALELGAVDFLPKPGGRSISLGIEEIRDELLRKVRAAARARPRRLVLRKKRRRLRRVKLPENSAVVFGASTGGPGTLMDILPALPAELPPVFIVQHMPPGFTASFASRLDTLTKFEVKEASDGDPIEPGTGYVAPGDYHMEIRRSRIRLNRKPRLHGVRPAVDVTMESAADVYECNTVGVLLTGMGCDGAAGLRKIKEAGGRTIVESEETCVVFGMPKAAIEAGAAEIIAPSYRIADELLRVLAE